MKDRALVLGGGGVAGIAWMTGLLLGLEECGIDLRTADLVIGTSAGSTLGAQLGSKVPLHDLFQRMTDPARQSREIAPDLRLVDSFRRAIVTLAAIPDQAERIRQVGKLALEASTPAEGERRAAVARRLPSHSWPETALRIVAIDAHSGETTVFDRDSEVDLVDAVTASCAVPGLWSPATIRGKRYMDGGARTPDNADLAKGYARVCIVSPVGTNRPMISGGGLQGQIDLLQQSGSGTYLISPDSGSRKAIGLNPLALETRKPAAEAGREQGQGMSQELAAFWNRD